MKNIYIQFETAKLALEKGYRNKGKWGYYAPQGGGGKQRNGNQKGFPEFGAAPRQDYLQKWLRDVHKIHIEIFLSDNYPYTGYYYRVMEVGQYLVTSHDGIISDSYEEALEKGLLEALKAIKTKE